MTTTLEPPALVRSARSHLAELASRPVDWEAEKDRCVQWWFERESVLYAAEPRAVSPVPAGTDIRAAVIGSAMLGLEMTPQGALAAAVLEAVDRSGLPLYDEVTVQIPRRATKTTTVQLVLLGRCQTRPGYKVIQTAQDGTRASAVFMEMVRTLERVTPEPADRDWTVFRSTGREYLEWANGSRWWVVPPVPSAYRSQAADCLWFDEAGEHDPVAYEELEAGALPTMDTRRDSQVIRSGTPGLLRSGPFWDALELGRQDPKADGVVDFSADDTDVVDAEGMTEDQVQALLLKVHPGLACGLTSMAKMMKRFRKMDLAKFIREYLCVWPPDTKTTALDLVRWAEGTVTPGPPPPGTPWALGYNVGIGAVAGAIAAAWYDDKGHPHAQIMEYRIGHAWMTDELAKAIRANPRVPVGYDNIGENIAVAQELGRKPRLNVKGLKSLQLRQVAAATATVAKTTKDGTFLHGASKALDNAAAAATWRESGGNRLFRRMDGSDISALLAVVHALGAAADLKKRTGGGVHAPLTGEE